MKETILRLTPDGFKMWKLLTEFRQTIIIDGKKHKIKVPKNTRTDLASVPRILWFLIPPFGRYSQAAVIHDYLYSTGKVSKLLADKIFFRLMLKYGTYKWKAIIMYLAVFLFGKGSFKGMTP